MYPEFYDLCRRLVQLLLLDTLYASSVCSSVRPFVCLFVTLVSRVKIAEHVRVSVSFYNLFILIVCIIYRNEIPTTLPSTGPQIHLEPLKDVPLCFSTNSHISRAIVTLLVLVETGINTL